MTIREFLGLALVLTSCGGATRAATLDAQDAGTDAGICFASAEAACADAGICGAPLEMTNCGAAVTFACPACPDAGTRVIDGGCPGAPGDLMACGDFCEDTWNDAANCGACGSVCQAGASCSRAHCYCPHHQTTCHDVCVDYVSSVDNCGRCDRHCDAGQICQNGACLDGTPDSGR
jgi:hypothetical protein